jgi:hypothetical protein
VELVVTLFIAIGTSLGLAAFVAYRRVLRRAKNIERGLKMVPILIHLPPPSQDTQAANREVREVVREKIAQAQVLYDLIAGTAQRGFKSKFYGQRHIAFEIIASNGLIYYYAAVPVAMVNIVEQAIVTAYPGARLEEAEDHNIFNPDGKINGVFGGELTLKQEASYPIATFDKLERDPMEALINVLSGLTPADGAAVQILLRPADTGWVKKSIALVRKKRSRSGMTSSSLGFTPADLARAALKSPMERQQQAAALSPAALQLTDLEQSIFSAIEEKTKHPAYEVLIRILTSGATSERAHSLLNEVATSFALFDAPGLNGFKLVPARDIEGLVTAFIFRFFPPELKHDILNSMELATLFHLPDHQFTPSTDVVRQQSKQVDGPAMVPSSGLLMGYNTFRGVKKEIRLSPEDRRRHTYIVGQTGTGKSTILENLAVQDMLAGNGFAFIDPHGDTAEKLISMVPKNRTEDIIYFNPSDTQYPLGLNLFEFSSPEQKDFLIQEAINMLYKIYDPGKTGIIGPRFEQWFRNAALTLMSDPAGATFIEIPKVFTDTAFLKSKFPYLTDPTVIDFWTKEMAQTSDYHKSEMLGWFNSKFGAFAQNEIMRNIIGQPKSAFNLREVMDNKKILIVNLSKGALGELNANLLGMMFVIKFQAAAMSRADVPESSRPDFSLYVDEFQNFSTDSFASILSEARKYRLNLIVANQFIGQLTDQIRDAVFGNVGTILAYRCGPEDAEFLVKQFAPIFDAHDLVNLPNFNAVVRLMLGGLPSQPFSMQALPPLGLANPELGMAVKQLSAAKFGQSKSQVEATILGRMKAAVAAPSSPPQPSLPAAAPTAISLPDAAPPPSPAASAGASVVNSAPTPVTPRPIAPVDPGSLSITDITKNLPDPTAKPFVAPATDDSIKLMAPSAMESSEVQPETIDPPALADKPESPAQEELYKPEPDPKPSGTDEASRPGSTPPHNSGAKHSVLHHKPHPDIKDSNTQSHQDSKRPIVSSGQPIQEPEIKIPEHQGSIAEEIKEAGLESVIQINPLDSILNASSAVLVAPSAPAPSAGLDAPPTANPPAPTAPPPTPPPTPPLTPVAPSAPAALPSQPPAPAPAAAPEPIKVPTTIAPANPPPGVPVQRPQVAQLIPAVPPPAIAPMPETQPATMLPSMPPQPSVVKPEPEGPLPVVKPEPAVTTPPAKPELVGAGVWSSPVKPGPNIPTLAPGEIYVDENGVVHTGE